MAYGSNIPSMGNDIPHGPIPEILFSRTLGNTMHQMGPDGINDGVMTNGVREQIARTMREFSFTPKGYARVYQKPYLEYFNTIPYSQGFRVPDFTKFTDDDKKTTYEHVGQSLAQINDASITDAHKIRLFPLSLSDTTFN
jgi:hypothetical protein